jgi:ribosomal protein L37AE/L43A
MAQFIQQYGTEVKCYRALYGARWPQEFRCPKCNGRPRSRFRRAGRVYYQCRDCLQVVVNPVLFFRQASGA